MVENRMRHFQEWLCYQLEAADGSGGSRRQVFARRGAGEEQRGLFGRVGHHEPAGRPGPADAQPRVLRHRRVGVVQPPRSPRVPISHMSVRYVEAGNGEAWFGGGLDLTPVYVAVALNFARAPLRWKRQSAHLRRPKFSTIFGLP